MDFLFGLLQASLICEESLKEEPTKQEWEHLYKFAEEQAVTGVLLSGLNKLQANHRPPKDILLQWIGVCEMIMRQNTQMDSAVIALCKELDDLGVRYMVVKGQTLNAIYPEKGVRQSGDIDFIIHPDYWEKTYNYFTETLDEDKIDTHTEKHVEWEKKGISYEMHRRLNDFASKKHQRYWDNVIMNEAWVNPWTVEINDYPVPTLAPTYNVLFVFVHLYYHFINEGVGLRQFVDWYYLIDKWESEIDKCILEKHLKGIGLFHAFLGLGAVLTDFLGLDKSKFPYEISEKNHHNSLKLIDNILDKGNFGHNTKYVQPHGMIHGLQQFWQVFKQCVKFGHYAPTESWGYLIVKIRWWIKKLNMHFK